MEKTLLNKLMRSLKEAKAISQGRLKPSRRFVVSPSDVKAAHNMVAYVPRVGARDFKSCWCGVGV